MTDDTNPEQLATKTWVNREGKQAAVFLSQLTYFPHKYLGPNPSDAVTLEIPSNWVHFKIIQSALHEAGLDIKKAFAWDADVYVTQPDVKESNALSLTDALIEDRSFEKGGRNKLQGGAIHFTPAGQKKLHAFLQGHGLHNAVLDNTIEQMATNVRTFSR